MLAAEIEDFFIKLLKIDRIDRNVSLFECEFTPPYCAGVLEERPKFKVVAL